MRNWKLKATVQKSISFLPKGRKINYALQKYVTKGVDLTDAYFYDRLNHASDHIHAYQRHRDLSSLEYSLELGTGWYPIVPIALFLCGVRDIFTLDIENHTNKENFRKTIQKFIDAKNFDTLRTFIPYRADNMRFLESLIKNYDVLTFEKVLHLFNLTIIIGDARNIKLKDNTFQLIHSNNTFEHIDQGVLESILTEFKRLINKTNGVMSHFIDMSDHFAHFDPSISIYNFLKFSDSEWKAIDNSIQPQNRLRMSDYLELYKKLDIPVTAYETRAGKIEELKKIKLNAKYQSKSATDVAISHARIESSYT
jgi:hypothetical protein